MRVLCLSESDFHPRPGFSALQASDKVDIIFKVLIYRLKSESPVKYQQLVAWWNAQ